MGTRSANPRAASATSVAANARFAGGSVGGGSKSRDIHGKYDPVNRTGLLPRDTRESANSSSAYIVSGRTVQSTGSEFVGEKIGFQKASLLKRKREQRNAEEEILSLLGRDGGRTEGGRNLMLAMGDETSGGGEAGEAPKRKSAFSAEDIRRIGFDPTLKGAGGVRREESIRETKERVSSTCASSLLPWWHTENDLPTISSQPSQIFQEANLSGSSSSALCRAKNSDLRCRSQQHRQEGMRP